MTGPFDVELVAPPPKTVASALTPVRVTNVSEQVAERLVTAISLGEFVAGQRLPPVAQLAEMLSVKQASVREALQRLAARGYVEVRRGRTGGAFVSNGGGPDTAEIVHRLLAPNWESFEHLFDLRRLTEPLIAHTAAQRYTAEDGVAIRAANEAYVDAGPDREASRAADQTLHTTIARATQNPYLVSLSLQLRARISLGFQAEPYSPDIRRRAIIHHERLVKAVLAKDGAAAADAAREHFALTEDAMRALYDRVSDVRGREASRG